MGNRNCVAGNRSAGNKCGKGARRRRQRKSPAMLAANPEGREEGDEGVNDGENADAGCSTEECQTYISRVMNPEVEETGDEAGGGEEGDGGAVDLAETAIKEEEKEQAEKEQNEKDEFKNMLDMARQKCAENEEAKFDPCSPDEMKIENPYAAFAPKPKEEEKKPAQPILDADRCKPDKMLMPNPYGAAARDFDAPDVLASRTSRRSNQRVPQSVKFAAMQPPPIPQLPPLPSCSRAQTLAQTDCPPCPPCGGQMPPSPSPTAFNPCPQKGQDCAIPQIKIYEQASNQKCLPCGPQGQRWAWESPPKPDNLQKQGEEGEEGAGTEDLPVTVACMDMPKEQFAEILTVCRGVLANCSVEVDIAKEIKRTLDRMYGPVWMVVVGDNFGVFVTYQQCRFVHFYIGDQSIVVFKSMTMK